MKSKKYEAKRKTTHGEIKVKSKVKLEVADEIANWLFQYAVHHIKHRTAWDKDYTKWEKGSIIIECNFKAK